MFHHEEVRQLVKSKKVQVVTLPLMRRHMFAVHFLLHKSSVLALMLMLMILMCFV